MIHKHEKLRKKISSFCSALYATEETPISCEKEDCMILTIGHNNAMGLSELELPQITEIFHNNEAIVWVKIFGENKPREIDDLTISDLEDIVKWFKDELNIA